MSHTINTRENWLVEFVRLLRPFFTDKGIEIPPNVRVSCGWPLGRRGTKKARSATIGQCFSRRASKDGSSEIFVSPELDDGLIVSAVVVHEVIHAVDDCRNGHRGPFRKMAIALGLQGPMRATYAGPELKERLNALCRVLGPYPHARLDASQISAKQRARLIKVVCDNGDHHYPAWTTRIWLDEGTPTCPRGHRMLEVTRKV